MRPLGRFCLCGSLAYQVAAQQPLFRSSVEYVQLDVVVTDRDDRPVTGLRQTDFEIVERGKPQTIISFQSVSIPAARRTVVDIRNAAPSIDVASNAYSPAGRQWVLVIDDLHIIEQHLLHTRKVVQEFLESLPADDQVAIVFVGRSDLSQDFTSDLGAQIRTVNRIKDALGFAYDAADRGGGSVSPGAGVRDRLRYGLATADVLKNVATSIARSTHSRKAVVFVSEGMTFPPDAPNEVIDALREFYDIARKAGVPVYAIDPRGQLSCTYIRGDCGNLPVVNARIQWNQMRELSENTGGRAFVGYADTIQAVRELIAENNSYYLLGYYPEPLDRDGKFHSVEVRIKDRSNLKVRARAGYTASKAVKATSAEARQTLDDALGAALPVAGLPLRAAAAAVAIGEKGMNTAVTLDVTYPDLPATTFDDSLAFGIVAIDHDGKIKAQMRGTYQYSATPKPGQKVSYTINAAIDLPAQPLTLRIAVASQTLDRVASIHLPVEVMNPSRDGLQIGAIVLGFAGGQRQIAVPAGALKGLVPIQPTLVRVFAPSDTLQIHAPLFWRGTAAGSAIVNIAVRNGGRMVRRMQVTVAGDAVNTRTISRSQQAAVTGTVGLQELALGDYALDLEARLTTGSIARRTVSFSIR